MISPIHKAALLYAAKGWAVFPVQPGGKAPLGQLVPRGHLDATTSVEQINIWWGLYPEANVGIAVAASGLVVLDVDVAEGKPGKASLLEIDAELTDTLTAITGRGGLHVIYSRPSDVAPARRIGFKPGLDLLGDGYIVAAPSTLREGGVYRWNRDIAPTPLPQVLRAAAIAARAMPEKVQLTGSPIESGSRNNSLFRLGAALRDTGIGAEALARALDAENKQRFKPPVDDAELSDIIDSVLRRVQPSRDVAAGAIVEQQIHDIFAVPEPLARSSWVDEVALVAQPPMVFHPTGFDQLDVLLGGGVATRQVCGVIGPPSAGKSAFVGSLALTLQLRVPILHVSTELPRHELMIRYAAHKMGFAWREGMKGAIPQDAMHDAVKGTRIRLLGCDDLDRDDPLGSVFAEAVKMKGANGGVAPIIIVDYVQLLARGSDEKTRSKVGELTMKLRIMSQVLDCVVIAVFSTSRAFYGGKALDAKNAEDDPTKYLAAAKESGDIEFDCATILYLDVDKLHEGNPKPARIAVARCRVGDIGFAGARAQLDIGRWWGDVAAVAEMSVEERGAKRDEGKIERACERLLAVVTKMPGRTWREMRVACKYDGRLVDAAKAQLLENGTIELETYDEMHKRLKYPTLKLRNTNPLLTVPGEPPYVDEV